MSDAQLKETLQLFADAGKELRPPYLLVDTTEFKRGFNEDIMKWRESTIVPFYNASGVKKMAFLDPDTKEPGSEPASEGSATFPTGWFSSREDLYKWFGG